MLNPDFKDMLSAFIAERVEFLIVGAYALSAHGITRATGDLDFWIRRSEENATRVLLALRRFGAPTEGVTMTDFVTPDLVLQIGVEPHRVDILTAIDGIAFDDAWPNRLVTHIDGLDVPLLGVQDLVTNKRAAGRPKDLADLAQLQANMSDRHRP